MARRSVHLLERRSGRTSPRASASDSQPASGEPTGSGRHDSPPDSPDAARSRPSRPRRPLPSSAHFLHTSNDSLPRTGFPGAPHEPGEDGGLQGGLGGQAEAQAAGVLRARRHASLAAALVQFVSKLPTPSPGSPAAALRSKLGARLALPALGEWVGQVAEALRREQQQGQRGEQGQGEQGEERQAAAGSGAAAAGALSPAAPPAPAPAGLWLGSGSGADDVELCVERMLAAQPQLLAQDSQVLAARLRGLSALLALHPSEALSLAAQRPGLLLLDGPTLERRLAALQTAMGLPDAATAAELARRQPAWLYAELGPGPGPG